ncbi:MAG: Holliday junction branch migration protein RuvA [Bauldia sp.]|nr:Holliday junction branch migration protein RuvA [Bauldia sp.]
MIGKLRGVVDSYGDDYVILDVGGVGYQVFCSGRTLQALPRPGEAASVQVETYVREDLIRLYGFAGDLEREWFRLLMTVQGIGAKVALGILGALSPTDLATAIALSDKTSLSRAPGVGKKVAERLVAELRDKAPAYASADPAVVHLQSDLAEKRAPQPVAEAVSALVNLGYAQLQASAAVAAAARAAGEGATTETLIRLGLKELAR